MVDIPQKKLGPALTTHIKDHIARETNGVRSMRVGTFAELEAAGGGSLAPLGGANGFSGWSMFATFLRAEAANEISALAIGSISRRRWCHCQIGKTNFDSFGMLKSFRNSLNLARPNPKVFSCGTGFAMQPTRHCDCQVGWGELCKVL